MFLLNSRRCHFIATLSCSIRRDFTITGHTLSRSYGIILPSSLTGVLPKTLEYSSYPPESVLVRSDNTLLAKLFSEAWSQLLCESYDSRTHLSALAVPFNRTPPAYRLEPPNRLDGQPILLRPSSYQQISSGAGILTCLPSTTPFGLALGCRLTLGGQPCPRKPWTFGREDSHLPIATHADILTSMLSSKPHSSPSARMERSPTAEI